MLIDRLKLAAITMIALLAAVGVGVATVAQQAAEKGQEAAVSVAQVGPKDKPSSQRIFRLSGTTDVDPATQTIVRSQFDSRVDKVLVDLGSTVRKGDPLLELFSTDLAEAKNDFEAASSQHDRDLRVLDRKATLAKAGNLTLQDLTEVVEDEGKSRLALNVAKKKLRVFGLTETEIADIASEEGVQKAKMILRSRSDGVVTKRSVVLGNYYDAKDELMQIARLDHLWVRGSVSELDADKVEVGQKLSVEFPYSGLKIETKVEYIEKSIDAETRSAKFRTSIPNPEGKFKPGMFVRVLLEVPLKSAQTTEPRTSADRTSRLSLQHRLENLKTKLDRLIKTNPGRPATLRLEERLGDLEQEMDRLIKETAGK
jgi:cobalt-zinc-cadmium efflux system membrane fusion protein